MNLQQAAQDLALTWNPARAVSHIRPLLEAAADLGIRINDADRYAAVCALRPPEPAPEPGRILDLSDEERLERAQRAAHRSVVREAVSQVLAKQVSDARLEFVESLQAQAEVLVDQMREHFDRAAEITRAAAAAGVSASMTPDAVIAAGDKQVRAWRRLTADAVPLFDKVVTARIELALATGQAPCDSVARWVDPTVMFEEPAVEREFLVASPNWRHWLRAASRLRLTSIAETHERQWRALVGKGGQTADEDDVDDD